ncbi:ATP-dependent helicase [Chloroflexia bacterium SDU3-3]|nr:ATP-dependent helicase [Chloroflexia bacterium SDU3-3]
MADINDVLRNNLTDEQYLAAKDTSREILCLACAGSGKSRTLSFRIARLIAEGALPSDIVAFTFTEKAAESIKRQVAKALEISGLPSTILGAMYIGTIHSYCHKILGDMDARYRQFDILDDNRLILYLISRYPKLGIHQIRSRNSNKNGYFDTIKKVSDAWKTMNDEMLEIDIIKKEDRELGDLLQVLKNQLERDQFIDFSLIVNRAVKLLQINGTDANRAIVKLKHLMVDEYQDVNPVQETLIKELHKRSDTLFVVGDDDQSIYSWRGADVTNILTFEQRYSQCKRYRLSHNFRSTPAIVHTADLFAAAELGPTRITKDPSADTPNGPRDFRNLWFQTRADEATWVAERIMSLLGSAYEDHGRVRGLTPGDFSILMRSTRSLEGDQRPRHAAFTDALEALRVPFTLEAGGGVFERPEVNVLRETFNLLREKSPDRQTALDHFNNQVVPIFPFADFGDFARILAEWGRLIHAPVTSGSRRRVYPQRLVHELLQAFGIQKTRIDSVKMRDLGVFSRMIQDVESVYISIDTKQRFQEILNFLNNVAETGYDTSTDDVLQRPDAVTIATVHKVKGLEYPVTFIVDVERQRFPNSIRKYDGYLPKKVIQPALQRGAYQGSPDEEARLFYTALTRAERFLYVTGSELLPAGKLVRRPSPFASRLQHIEISKDPSQLPLGLVPALPIPRIDETVVPTSYSDIKYYLRCPKDYQFRKSFGFSPPVPTLFGYGKTVHTAVEKLHEIFLQTSPTGDEAEEIARQIFHLKHVPPSNDPVNRPGGYERAQDSACKIVRKYVEDFVDDFSQEREVEVRFEVPVMQAVISGSIDLLLKLDQGEKIVDARVIDFKAMEGGDNPEENEDLHWTELALQVQLYAKAARDVLGEEAKTGAVHLLKDGQRIDVPINDAAVQSAISNVEWAVDRILKGDFPMRPHHSKCASCDFKLLCPKIAQDFQEESQPSDIYIPGDLGIQAARAFSEFEH